MEHGCQTIWSFNYAPVVPKQPTNGDGYPTPAPNAWESGAPQLMAGQWEDRHGETPCLRMCVTNTEGILPNPVWPLGTLTTLGFSWRFFGLWQDEKKIRCQVAPCEKGVKVDKEPKSVKKWRYYLHGIVCGDTQKGDIAQHYPQIPNRNGSSGFPWCSPKSQSKRLVTITINPCGWCLITFVLGPHTNNDPKGNDTTLRPTMHRTTIK